MTALATLAAWRPLLVELAGLGEVLGAAIEGGDLVRAIATMMRMRDVRAALSRVELADTRGDVREAAALAEVRPLIERARGAEAIAARWQARELPSASVLAGTPLGAAVLADAMLPAVWDRETDLVVIVGAGLELVIEVLVDLGQRRIVALGAAADVDEPDTAIRAIRAATTHEVTAAVRTLVPSPPQRVVVRGATGVSREEVDAASAATQDALSDLRIHRNTIAAFSRTWIDHGIANLPAIARAPSVAAVGDRLRGLPMVIVAPGPSLARNAHLLASLRGRALVCAFSHSLRPVIAAGVTPDFVLTVDPQDVRYHFTGCDVSRTTVINAATVHPALYELPAERFLSLAANSAIDDWIFDGLVDGERELERCRIAGGGSVATTALSLALAWGCNPIAFVGLDLSFPDGAYYVDTSHDGGARAVVGDDGTIRVEGWSAGFRAMKAGGGPRAPSERSVELPAWNADDRADAGRVPSSFMFSMFHRWFVERVAGPEAAATTIYNCTEGGALIPGMRHRPLAELLATLPTGIDARAALADLTADPACATRAATRVAAFGSALARTRSLARHADALAAKGDERGLVRAERALARSLRPIPFVSLLAQREIERAQDIAKRSDQDYLGASRALFATLVDVVDRLSPPPNSSQAT